MDDHVGLLQEPERPEGQEVRIARAGADDVHQPGSGLSGLGRADRVPAVD